MYLSSFHGSRIRSSSLLGHVNLCSEHYFPTQAADIPESDPSEKKETAENKERNSPDQFTSSKMLMDAKPNPDVLKPISEDCGM